MVNLIYYDDWKGKKALFLHIGLDVYGNRTNLVVDKL